MTTIRLVIVVFAVFVSACASAAEEPNAPSVVDVPAAPPSEGIDIPRHTLAGEQSPGDKFGAMPSWPVDPDMCANTRFVRDGSFVTDSTTGLTWGVQEALAFTPASTTFVDQPADPPGAGAARATAFANAVCNARYSGTRAATKAEIDVIAKAVPNCPLPGAFYSTDLWNAMTGDAKCIDLKTDQETRTIATCSAQPFHVDNGNDGDVLRVALCVK
jgi:hypothetical protein